jgi:hypothetical protein
MVKKVLRPSLEREAYCKEERRKGKKRVNTNLAQVRKARRGKKKKTRMIIHYQDPMGREFGTHQKTCQAHASPLHVYFETISALVLKTCPAGLRVEPLFAGWASYQFGISVLILPVGLDLYVVSSSCCYYLGLDLGLGLGIRLGIYRGVGAIS